MTWINRLNAMGPAFSVAVMPTPVPNPSWVSRNKQLGQNLGLPHQWLEDQEGLANWVMAVPCVWVNMKARKAVLKFSSKELEKHLFPEWVMAAPFCDQAFENTFAVKPWPDLAYPPPERSA